jgi:hypothetical protein
MAAYFISTLSRGIGSVTFYALVDRHTGDIIAWVRAASAQTVAGKMNA